MKFKTLRRKDTKEFATYQGSHMGISEIPTILANTATIENIKGYHEDFVVPKHNIDPEDIINWNDYEIIELEIKIIE